MSPWAHVAVSWGNVTAECNTCASATSLESMKLLSRGAVTIYKSPSSEWELPLPHALPLVLAIFLIVANLIGMKLWVIINLHFPNY